MTAAPEQFTYLCIAAPTILFSWTCRARFTQRSPMAGVKDSSTIATVPIFRTHNTKPKFTISATSNFAQNAAALVPTQAFYQVDGWQGTWKAVTLKAKGGSLTSSAKVTLSALSTGRHILYAYATDGDVATVQASGTGTNSPVISPI